MIAETSNWFLLSDSVVQNANLIKFRDAIFFYRVMGL